MGSLAFISSVGLILVCLPLARRGPRGGIGAVCWAVVMCTAIAGIVAIVAIV